MDRPIFNPLVALEMKPEVTSIPVVNIRFPGAKKIDVEGSLQIVERPGVKIVNKRKGPEYRDQILQRLYKNADLPFSKRIQTIPDIFTEEESVTIQPTKKGRMIIRDKIVRGPGIFVEEIETQVLPEPSSRGVARKSEVDGTYGVERSSEPYTRIEI